MTSYSALERLSKLSLELSMPQQSQALNMRFLTVMGNMLAGRSAYLSNSTILSRAVNRMLPERFSCPSTVKQPSGQVYVSINVCK